LHTDGTEAKDGLKKELRENYDHALIPKTAFDKFAQWYYHCLRSNHYFSR